MKLLILSLISLTSASKLRDLRQEAQRLDARHVNASGHKQKLSFFQQSLADFTERLNKHEDTREHAKELEKLKESLMANLAGDWSPELIDSMSSNLQLLGNLIMSDTTTTQAALTAAWNLRQSVCINALSDSLVVPNAIVKALSAQSKAIQLCLNFQGSSLLQVKEDKERFAKELEDLRIRKEQLCGDDPGMIALVADKLEAVSGLIGLGDVASSTRQATVDCDEATKLYEARSKELTLIQSSNNASQTCNVVAMQYAMDQAACSQVANRTAACRTYMNCRGGPSGSVVDVWIPTRNAICNPGGTRDQLEADWLLFNQLYCLFNASQNGTNAAAATAACFSATYNSNLFYFPECFYNYSTGFTANPATDCSILSNSATDPNTPSTVPYKLQYYTWSNPSACTASCCPTTTTTTTPVPSCATTGLAFFPMFSNIGCTSSPAIFDLVNVNNGFGFADCSNQCSQYVTCTNLIWVNSSTGFTRCRGYSDCGSQIAVSASAAVTTQLYIRCPTTTTTTTNILAGACQSLGMVSLKSNTGCKENPIFDNYVFSPTTIALADCQAACQQAKGCAVVNWINYPGQYSRCTAWNSCTSVSVTPNQAITNQLYAYCTATVTTTSATTTTTTILTTTTTTTNMLLTTCLTQNVDYALVYANRQCNGQSAQLFSNTVSNLTTCQSACTQAGSACLAVSFVTSPSFSTCRAYRSCPTVGDAGAASGSTQALFANCRIVRTTTTTTTTTTTMNLFSGVCLDPSLSFDLINNYLECGAGSSALFDNSFYDQSFSQEACQAKCTQAARYCKVVRWQATPTRQRCSGYTTCVATPLSATSNNTDSLYANCVAIGAATTTTTTSTVCTGSSYVFSYVGLACGVGSVLAFDAVNDAGDAAAGVCQQQCNQDPTCSMYNLITDGSDAVHCIGFRSCVNLFPLPQSSLNVQSLVVSVCSLNWSPTSGGSNIGGTVITSALPGGAAQCKTATLGYELTNINSVCGAGSTLLFQQTFPAVTSSIASCKAACDQAAGCTAINWAADLSSTTGQCTGYMVCLRPVMRGTASSNTINSRLFARCFGSAVGSPSTVAAQGQQVANTQTDPACTSGLAQVKLTVAATGQCLLAPDIQAYRWYQDLNVVWSSVSNPVKTFTLLLQTKSEEGSASNSSESLSRSSVDGIQGDSNIVPHIVVQSNGFVLYVDGGTASDAAQVNLLRNENTEQGEAATEEQQDPNCCAQKALIAKLYPAGATLNKYRCMDNLMTV